MNLKFGYTTFSKKRYERLSQIWILQVFQNKYHNMRCFFINIHRYGTFNIKKNKIFGYFFDFWNICLSIEVCYSYPMFENIADVQTIILAPSEEIQLILSWYFLKWTILRFYMCHWRIANSVRWIFNWTASA